ncbi:uncharacterized protein [Chelonus insularis]|uniref:uncharacterized protein n=1 Tax=Chelonus insularis TaxID=460826 RepID=UPI0015888447|nr:uncharacterized protein LOC118068460 [Chelonus insularis]
MILMQIGIIALVTCILEFSDAQKKVIFLMPRHVKRSHGTPWRQFIRPPFLKATQFLDNEFLPTHHPKQVLLPGHPRPRGMVQFNKHVPHGGDDFDQGHEEVNHVIIPHGKGITHAISFGKGYIPHDALMHHAGFTSSSDSHESPDDSVNYNSLTPVYITPQMTQQADVYYQNNEADQYHDEIQDRKIDDLHVKFLKAKAIAGINPQVSGKLIVHQEQPKSNGNKAYILRDTINFDEYNKKVAELTKSWPTSSGSQGPVLSTGSLGIISVKPESLSPLPQLPQIPKHTQHNIGDHPDTSNIITSINLHPPQGYSVKEEIQDIPHDFRTMPIQTNPVRLPTSTGLHVVHPFQNPVNQISPASTAIPGFYALSGYSGLLPG